ncbi:unnamed protein product, partial [Rotaria sp. Silwood1]
GVTDTSVQYKALGIFYLDWTIFTLDMLIACIRTNIALILFFFFLMVTYALFTAAITWYVGFASLMIKGDNVCFNLPVFVLSPQSRIVVNGESTAEVHAQKM